MSTKASKGECTPKKKADQRRFNPSWAKNNLKAILDFLLFDPLLQTKKSEIPIKTKRVVQTGPKIQLGGLNEGLFKVVYQPCIEEIVSTEPINATA